MCLIITEPVLFGLVWIVKNNIAKERKNIPKNLVKSGTKSSLFLIKVDTNNSVNRIDKNTYK